jgi:hypothetical protein
LRTRDRASGEERYTRAASPTPRAPRATNDTIGCAKPKGPATAPGRRRSRTVRELSDKPYHERSPFTLVRSRVPWSSLVPRCLPGGSDGGVTHTDGVVGPRAVYLRCWRKVRLQNKSGDVFQNSSCTARTPRWPCPVPGCPCAVHAQRRQRSGAQAATADVESDVLHPSGTPHH